MQANLMMYGGAPQGQGGQQQEGVPEGQPPMQGYPGLFPPGPMPFFSQSQAAAAHAAAAMAEQRLSGMEQQGGYGGGYPGGYAGGYGGDEFMDANRLWLARLQQQGAQGNWLPMGYGYGMPQPPPDSYTDNGMMGPWSTTSAGLLGRIGNTEEKKKTVRKKHKDKPKRPLSAYNLFFKDERATILQAIPTKGDEGEEEDKKEEGEEQDDDDDKKKGRKRKKTPHGKIGFESLAKTIGQRWQKLEGERMEYYKKLAAEDMKRYKEQMEGFLTKLENDKKKKFEPDQGGAAAEEEDYEPAAKKVKTEEEPEEED